MSLPLLNRKLKLQPGVMPYPVKALQIGEGNFIRGFVDWMLSRCNEQGYFQGSVVVSQPRASGSAKLRHVADQDGLFTVVERGIEQRQTVNRCEVVDSISLIVDPFLAWEQWLALAEETQLRFVFSNTTEAGIVYQAEVLEEGKPVVSFPGRLTIFLHRRFVHLGADAGLIMLPCELLERAGDTLQALVLRYAQDWSLGVEFERFIKERNHFVNSLVDRIVSGYPTDASSLFEQLGYEDHLLTVAEPYYQWVIEAGEEIAKELPLTEAGLNVLWVSDLAPYVKRKVRILNGAHTFITAQAFLRGHNLVREVMQDEELQEEVKHFLSNIVAPVLPFSREESSAYIEQTLERFRNPFMDHKLLDIALNSMSKFRTRLLPTLQEIWESKQEVPITLLNSLAYWIRFYRVEPSESGGWQGSRFVQGRMEAYPVIDSDKVIQAFHKLWAEQANDEKANVHAIAKAGLTASWVRRVLTCDDIWVHAFSELQTELLDQVCEGTAVCLKAIVTAEMEAKV